MSRQLSARLLVCSSARPLVRQHVARSDSAQAINPVVRAADIRRHVFHVFHAFHVPCVAHATTHASCVSECRRCLPLLSVDALSRRGRTDSHNCELAPQIAERTPRQQLPRQPRTEMRRPAAPSLMTQRKVRYSMRDTFAADCSVSEWCAWSRRRPSPDNDPDTRRARSWTSARAEPTSNGALTAESSVSPGPGARAPPPATANRAGATFTSSPGTVWAPAAFDLC